MFMLEPLEHAAALTFHYLERLIDNVGGHILFFQRLAEQSDERVEMFMAEPEVNGMEVRRAEISGRFISRIGHNFKEDTKHFAREVLRLQAEEEATDMLIGAGFFIEA